MPICILFHTSFACCSCRVCHPRSPQNTTLVTLRPGLGQNKRNSPRARPALTPWHVPLPPTALCAPECPWEGYHLRREDRKDLDSQAPTAFGIEKVPSGQPCREVCSPEDAGEPWHCLSSPACPGAASWWPCPSVPGSQPLCLAVMCPLTVLKVSRPLAWLHGLISVLPPPVPHSRVHTPGAVPRPQAADSECRMTGSHEVRRLQKPRPDRPTLQSTACLRLNVLTHRGPHPEARPAPCPGEATWCYEKGGT